MPYKPGEHLERKNATGGTRKEREGLESEMITRVFILGVQTCAITNRIKFSRPFKPGLIYI